MRAVLVLTILGCAAGCGDPPREPDAPDPPPFMVPIDPGGPIGPPSGCDDSWCVTGQVCVRTGGCAPADQVRAVHIYWTVRGQPANATTCEVAPSLYLQVSPAGGFGLGWAPVPCSQGKFTIDRIPASYTEVNLNKRNSGDTPQHGTIDAVTGEVTIDLPF
jgi:hypothetical protein